jgi:hypothetical protein
MELDNGDERVREFMAEGEVWSRRGGVNAG